MTSESIVSSEEHFGGKHRIKGTRIRVVDVVEAYQELGWDIEEISGEYGIKPQQVLDALRFFYDNKETVRRELNSGVNEANA